MLSLLIHAGLLTGAYFLVETIVTEKKVDFLPAGGSKAGQEASQQLSEQMNVKKRSLHKNTPMQRIVSTASKASISLPDMPLDTLDVPQMSSMIGAGTMSSGGFGSSGFAGTSGPGMGVGSVKGFVPRTVFGMIGGKEGLPGKFYDFKQDRNRKPLEYTPGMFGPALAKIADRRFSKSAMRDYYQAKQQVSFTFLTIPNMKAEEGPKAFQVEKEVEASGWFVHYSGVISAPSPGEWRFMGLFDDVLTVYINNKVVFDGGYAFFSKANKDKPDPEVNQEFGQNLFGPKFPTRVGKWVKIGDAAKIDIIVGEVPGMAVGGALFVQHKDTKYKLRPNGTPILPVFSTTKLDMEDMATIKKFSERNKFEIDENTPIFTVKKSVFKDGEGDGDDDGGDKPTGLLPRR